MNKLFTGIPVILAVIGMSLQSCEKTEVEYEKSPLNSIKRFTVLGSEGDSTRCLINGDSITVYWNPDVELPVSITPAIIVEEGATVYPASGEPVPFNTATIYTITAQNGATRTYWLNPSQNVPFPVISSVNSSVAWLSTTRMNINGEYFLANADTSEITVYMQRVADGFEFPLELIKNLTTNYAIRANLPAFSEEHDIGPHRLFVKTGDRTARPVTIDMLIPAISHVTRESDLLEKGEAIHPGDTLTIHYTSSDNYNGKIANYYSAGNVQTILLYISYDLMIPVTDFTVSDSTIKVILPDSIAEHAGELVSQCRLLFNSVPQDQVTSTVYRHDVSFFETPCTIVAE